jgi:raffinose/stachyose/melibiose transport system permease protein
MQAGAPDVATELAPSRTRVSARLLRRRAAPASAAEPRLVGYGYLLPGAALYVAFVLIPLVKGVRLSFFSWDGIGGKVWVGLHNYHQILSDPDLRSAFIHSFLLIIFYCALPISIGLLIAACLARARPRGFAFFRAVLFLPQIIPLVAAGAIWRWVYAPDGGLNSALGAVGLGSLEHGWLGDFNLALPAVGLVGTWVLTGLCMVLFLAGVQKIPPSLYDAARVDGARPLREFFAVTLPGLRNEISVSLVLTLIAALRSFDVVYVTTQGGPGTQTVVPAYLVYREAFFYGNVGTAAALGVTLALLVILATAIVLRVEGKATTR